MDDVLGEENKRGGWYDTVVPCIDPVTDIPGSSGTNVHVNSTAPAAEEKFALGFRGSTKRGRVGCEI